MPNPNDPIIDNPVEQTSETTVLETVTPLELGHSEEIKKTLSSPTEKQDTVQEQQQEELEVLADLLVDAAALIELVEAATSKIAENKYELRHATPSDKNKLASAESELINAQVNVTKTDSLNAALKNLDDVIKEIMSKRTVAQKVNDYRFHIKNSLAALLYTLLVQLPVNVLSKLSEIVTTPTFINHIKKNQRLGEKYYAEDKVAKLGWVAGAQRRLGLTLKLPVDIFTGFIKVLLFFPGFAMHAPGQMASDTMDFLSEEAKESKSFSARVLAATAEVVLLIPALALSLVDLVATGIDKLLNLVEENLINAPVSSVANVLAAVAFSPITVPMYLYNKAFGNVKPGTVKHQAGENLVTSLPVESVAANESSEPSVTVSAEVKPKAQVSAAPKAEPKKTSGCCSYFNLCTNRSKTSAAPASTQTPVRKFSNRME